MASEYILYCDESDAVGQYYSNFYGGALIHSKDLSLVTNSLSQQKERLHLFQEVKWAKVTSQYCDKYIQLIDLFFDFIQQDMVKIRIMFTQNVFQANNLNSYQREHGYFLLYYQFIKHAFGFKYIQSLTTEIRVRVYLDHLPVQTQEKVNLFKSYISGLSLSPEFRKVRLLIPQDQIAEVASHDHVILQCLDIVLGAMQFRLNDKHKKKCQMTNRRGKRTIAKEGLYKHINKRIREIYPNFNIGCSTSTKGDIKNIWLHPYRHWQFKPKDHEINLNKAKSRR